MTMLSERIVLVGLGLVLLGIVMLVFGSLLSAGKEKSSVRGGGIIFLGPIPLGFATDKKTLYVLLGFSIVVFVFWYFLLRR